MKMNKKIIKILKSVITYVKMWDLDCLTLDNSSSMILDNSQSLNLNQMVF